jgi:hypothetical protein
MISAGMMPTPTGDHIGAHVLRLGSPARELAGHADDDEQADQQDREQQGADDQQAELGAVAERSVFPGRICGRGSERLGCVHNDTSFV